MSIATSRDRQKIVLSNDEVISARLVVLANGLNVGLRHVLGIERQIISRCHSISIGFDIVPVGRARLRFSRDDLFLGAAQRPHPLYLRCFRSASGCAPICSPIGSSTIPGCANSGLRRSKTLDASLPRLKAITGEFTITGETKIRPADSTSIQAICQPGIVLVGDAFETTCPVTGTGTDKVFTDVEQLCNVHIPAWLATEGMGEDKIASFYDDPVKMACDAWSLAKAY